MAEYELGDWVIVSNKMKRLEGIILYIGKVDGHNDIQYGIELTDFSPGEHNGTYKNKHYFTTKDTNTNRAIFVLPSNIKRKMTKRDFNDPQRLETRNNTISNLSSSDKSNIHFDPLFSQNTIDIIEILGQYWLRYICLLLPTLDKFTIPRVCKTFHQFVTLEIGQEDTADAPPFDPAIYNKYHSMQLLVEDIIHDTEHSRLRNSITDELDGLVVGVQTPSPDDAGEKEQSRQSVVIKDESPESVLIKEDAEDDKAKKKNIKQNKKSEKKQGKKKLSGKKKGGDKGKNKGKEDTKLSVNKKGNKHKKSASTAINGSRKKKTSKKKVDNKKHIKSNSTMPASKKKKTSKKKKVSDKKKNDKDGKKKEFKPKEKATNNLSVKVIGNEHNRQDTVNINTASPISVLSPMSPIIDTSSICSPSMPALNEEKSEPPCYEFKERGLNEEEAFLWNELCKTEAMVKYVDDLYEGRMEISRKMRTTMKQYYDMQIKGEDYDLLGDENMGKIRFWKDGTGMLSSVNSAHHTESRGKAVYNILNGKREYNHILWIFASPFGEERQALDLETRRLIQAADERLFYEYINDKRIYKEHSGKLNLYNKRFLKRTHFERNVISYFLTFQNKLIEIYNGNNNHLPKELNASYYDDGKDDFYLIVSNLLHLDISSNSGDDLNSDDKFYCKSFSERNVGVLFLAPILSSSYSSLMALELTKCGLTDDDLHIMCNAWKKRTCHATLETLSLAENPLISDAYMDELFEVIANYLGNVMCLMLHDTAITDETCATILNFYKSQFSKSQIKNDKITKEINERYDVEIFQKELRKIQDSSSINNWKHRDQEIESFMYEIADDYGVIHKYYPETTDNNPYDAKWEQLYQQILEINNSVMTTETVIELYEEKIKALELAKEQELLSKPKRKRRSKLKQLRLHLNSGITRMGYVTLNDIFKKGYINKRDMKAVILIDGFVDDFSKITQYEQWLKDNQSNIVEYQDLSVDVKDIDHQIKTISNDLSSNMISNDMRAQLISERKRLAKEKEKLINRRFELNDLINEAKQEPMNDPKRNPKWDKRLMTNWNDVWTKWTDVTEYKNFI